MNNYVIAYLDMSNNYQIKFVSAEDPISALRRTIPKFVRVIESVQSDGMELSYDNIYNYVSKINIQTFSIIEVPQLSTESNIRMQIISVYNALEGTITLLCTNRPSQLDSLYATVTETYGLEPSDYLDSLYMNKDMRGIIMYFSNMTQLRVYTVSTLRQLVKESIKK